MSVWDNPCYNIEPLRKCVRLFDKRRLASFPDALYGVADFYTTKASRIATNFSDCHFGTKLRESPAAWREFKRQCFDTRTPKPDPIFDDAFKFIPPCYAGLKSVYWAFSKIWNKNWVTKTEYSQEELITYFDKIWKLSPYSSRINAQSWKIAGEGIKVALTNEWSRLDQASIAVNHFWVADRTKSFRSHAASYRFKGQKYPFVKVGGPMSILELVKFKSGYILYDRKTGESGLFFWKEHNRLVQMLNSAAKCEFYFAGYEVGNHSLNDQMLHAYHQLMTRITKAMITSSWDQCNYLCRALDVCQFLYLSELASDLSTRSMADQEAKIVDECLNDVIDIHGVINDIKEHRLGVKENLELLKVYKLLPTSDYCPYGVIDNFADKNDNHNVMCLDQQILLSNGDVLAIDKDEIRKYQRRSMLIMFKERHGRFPGSLKQNISIPLEMIAYPNIPDSSLSLDSVDLVDMSGSFQWRSYDFCEHELVKDKKTAMVNEEQKWFSDNQVLQYLFDPNFIPQNTVRQAYLDKSFDYKRNIAVALKAEAKKPKEKVRAFYMANDPDRRILSEFEANVGEYVNHKPGCSVGKSEKEILERLYEISNWEEPGKRPFLISFDIAGWSPKQDPAFKQMGLRQWAEVFDMPHILNLSEIFNQMKLVWDKMGIHGEYILQGNDLEGFNGKMNTGLHADVMGYAIKKCRDLGLVDKGGKFACFIDDGILNLQLDANLYESLVPRVLEVIEKVYWAFGLEISWDKTFTSEYFMQYLNKVYLDGQEVTAGLKAFLRIGKKVDVPSPTLYSELDNLASTVRGAIMAGADHRTSYAAYLLEAHHLCIYWSRFSRDFVFTDTMIASMIIPRNFGGLGISSLFSLSTNETFSALEAGLSAMRTLSIVMPEMRDFFSQVLANGVDEMGPLAILKAPRSLRNSKIMLKEERLSTAAVAVVKTKAVNPFIKSVAAALKLNTISVCADVISETAVITDFSRDRLWQIDPMNIIDALVRKLQTSSTAAKVVGRTKMAAILIANKYEAAKYLVELSRGIAISHYGV